MIRVRVGAEVEQLHDMDLQVAKSMVSSNGSRDEAGRHGCDCRNSPVIWQIAPSSGYLNLFIPV